MSAAGASPRETPLGTAGNDLPAVYLLDQNLGVEGIWRQVFRYGRHDLDVCREFAALPGLPLLQHYFLDSILMFGSGRALVCQPIRRLEMFCCPPEITQLLAARRPLTRLITEQEAVSCWMEALSAAF